MIKKIVINKSKSKAVIFIHGFYANPGFWLSYLHYFRDYKIILLHIDYNFLIKSNYSKEEINDLFNEIEIEKEVICIISHSLGTIISNTILTDTNTQKIEICPVGLANRINTQDFINELKLKVNDNEWLIKNNLSLVDSFILKMTESTNDNFKLIPNNDRYFEYIFPSRISVTFEGDHFNIDNALNFTSKRLSTMY